MQVDIGKIAKRGCLATGHLTYHGHTVAQIEHELHRVVFASPAEYEEEHLDYLVTEIEHFRLVQPVPAWLGTVWLRLRGTLVRFLLLETAAYQAPGWGVATLNYILHDAEDTKPFEEVWRWHYASGLLLECNGARHSNEVARLREEAHAQLKQLQAQPSSVSKLIGSQSHQPNIPLALLEMTTHADDSTVLREVARFWRLVEERNDQCFVAMLRVLQMGEERVKVPPKSEGKKETTRPVYTCGKHLGGASWFNLLWRIVLQFAGPENTFAIQMRRVFEKLPREAHVEREATLIQAVLSCIRSSVGHDTRRATHWKHTSKEYFDENMFTEWQTKVDQYRREPAATWFTAVANEKKRKPSVAIAPVKEVKQARVATLPGTLEGAYTVQPHAAEFQLVVPDTWSHVELRSTRNARTALRLVRPWLGEVEEPSPNAVQIDRIKHQWATQLTSARLCVLSDEHEREWLVSRTEVYMEPIVYGPDVDDYWRQVCLTLLWRWIVGCATRIQDLYVAVDTSGTDLRVWSFEEDQACEREAKADPLLAFLWTEPPPAPFASKLRQWYAQNDVTLLEVLRAWASHPVANDLEQLLSRRASRLYHLLQSL